MTIRHIGMGMILFLFCNSCFAIFCPNNFNQIEYGYTIQQVTELCGKPDKEEKKELAPAVAQEWTYFVKQSVGMGGSNVTQGTLKTSVVFDTSGAAINISVNGIGVGATGICGQPIQLGSTIEQIKSACGDPTMINKQETTPSGDPILPTPIVVYTYNSNPPATLIFQEGKLTEMK